MAIKGKRKPQKRGRPGAAPRPRAGAARPATGASRPFYRTFRGQLTIIVVVLALVGAGMWFISDRRADDKRVAQRQDALESYTESVKSLLSEAGQPVQELAGAPTEWAVDPVHEGYLATGSKRWVKAFQTSGVTASALTAPDGLQPTSSILMEAFQVYTSAARSYGDAAKLGGESASERQARKDTTQAFLDRAGEQRDAANRLVAAVIQLIDEARADADMRPSRLQAPSSLPPITPPDTVEPDDSGKKDGKKKKEKDE